MNQTLRDDTPRWKPPPEFLRELPDLISGKEPELLRPEAQAWLRRDPQAREYAQEICAAIAMFDGVPSRLTAPTREPISAHAKRSVQRAVRQLPQRLAEVLWTLLTVEFDRVGAENDASFLDPVESAGLTAVPQPELIRRRDELLRATRNCPSTATALRSFDFSCASTQTRNDTSTSASRLVATLRTIAGEGPLSTWSDLLLHRLGPEHTDRLNEWSLLVRDQSTALTNFHAHVLQTAALAFEARSQMQKAIELSDLVVRYHPSSSALPGAAYSGLKLACLGADRHLQTTFLKHFELGLDCFAAQRSAWTRQFLRDANDWTQALRRVPTVVCDLMSLLGTSRSGCEAK